VLQEGELWPLGMDHPLPVDVRVIAATNRDLEAEVEAGRFRRDLYFRLLGMKIELTPLRERMEDIPLLVHHLLERIAAEPGMRRIKLTEGAARELLRQRWPGNVRELEQVLRRSVLLTEKEVLGPKDLALSAGIHSRRQAIREFDRELVEQALRASAGNRSAAARALGISRATIHRWINRHKITL
jgi:transcriptional regulator with GAF, ATPase, and Fis domain